MTGENFPWTALIFGATNLIALALGWARLSTRLARMELLLEDAVSRPTRWCVAQQKECGQMYERREITGVGSAGHA